MRGQGEIAPFSAADKHLLKILIELKEWNSVQYFLQSNCPNDLIGKSDADTMIFHA